MRVLGFVGCVLACSLVMRPVMAGDLGGDCCADLEERVAELEATVATKGNRKVSLTLSGHGSRAVLFWDDGFESNAYSVGNKNDQTNFSLTGEAEIDSDWLAGYALTIRLLDSLSDEVNQFDDNSELGFLVWESFLYVESEPHGKISLMAISAHQPMKNTFIRNSAGSQN